MLSDDNCFSQHIQGLLTSLSQLKVGWQRHLEDFRPPTHQSATIGTLRNYVETRPATSGGGMPAMRFHDSPPEAI